MLPVDLGWVNSMVALGIDWTLFGRAAALPASQFWHVQLDRVASGSVLRSSARPRDGSGVRATFDTSRRRCTAGGLLEAVRMGYCRHPPANKVHADWWTFSSRCVTGTSGFRRKPSLLDCVPQLDDNNWSS
jgi:hypothetical protein